MITDKKQKLPKTLKILLPVVLIIGYMVVSLIRNGLFINEWSVVNKYMEKIVVAVNNRDEEALKSLFSSKALEECEDWTIQVADFFEFVKGNIISWEFKVIPSDDKMASGKRWLMVRASVNVHTDMEEYGFFFICYPVDTFDKSNKGLYMLEVHKQSYDGEWEAWQDRMNAGLSIIQ